MHGSRHKTPSVTILIERKSRVSNISTLRS
jgi:hypothetical protein